MGEDCVLRVGAHVGHNSRVGDRVRLGEHVLLAGHSHVGSDVTMGPRAGLHQFTRIGEWAWVEPNVTVRQDIVPFANVVAGGGVAGISEIVLSRFAPAEIEELRTLFCAFLTGHRSFRDLPLRVAEAARTAPGRRFAEFLSIESRHGYAGGRGPDA